MYKEFMKNWKVEEHRTHPHYEIYAEMSSGTWQRIASVEDHLPESKEIGKAIAAIPEMIDALEGVDRFYNQFIDIMPVAFQTEIDFVRKALEKVKGN